MSNQNDVRALPYFFVGKEIAKKRIQQFMSTKYPLLTQNSSVAETKSVWYSIEHIQALYEELLYLNASGLRIYFGSYLQPDTDSDIPEVLADAAEHADVAGQLSLLMIPTQAYLSRNNEPRHTDLIVEEMPGFNERLLGQTLAEFVDKKAFNCGSPCPPACIDSDTKFP